MDKEQTPDNSQASLSVLLPTDKPETIQGVLARLRRQTICKRIEVVIATPDPGAFEDLAQRESTFASVRVVPIDHLVPLGRARAEAVRAATAPFVFLGETHSFAAVDSWAEKLVARHREGWSIVVPGFKNANPGSTLSWAGFLLDYGNWLEESQPGEIEYWPLNNASCATAALIDQGDLLDHGLSHGDQLLLALRERGHKVYMEPSAVLAHLNLTRAGAWFDERWVGGDLVARERSRSWSMVKRILYVLASPLIGLVLFTRVSGPARRAIRRRDLSIGILPAMLAGTIVQGFGEMLGYTHLGSGLRSERHMTEYEINKVRYTSPSSRQ
jgi:hypothetical protein